MGGMSHSAKHVIIPTSSLKLRIQLVNNQLVILPLTDFQVGNFVTSWSLFSLSSTFRSYIGRDPSAVECLLCDFKLTKG